MRSTLRRMESLRGLSSSPASAYDELVTGQKSIRYHWQGILSVIRALPGGGLGERVESARRQLEESGATVNLLDDRGTPRWTFDPLPFVIAPDEWSDARGRADPARRACSTPSWPISTARRRCSPSSCCRRCWSTPTATSCAPAGSPTARRRRAISRQYAVDLVRLGDGRWHVLADHTEVPSGIGYALEIRRVLARSLPEAFRSIPVRHLRPVRRPLAQFAGRHGADRRGATPTWRC